MHIPREKTINIMRPANITFESGLGWVIAPIDVDFETYVTTSRLRSTVSLEVDSGEIYHDVLVSQQAMKYLKYPAKIQSRGSRVVWTKIEYQNQMLIHSTVLTDNDINDIATERQETGFTMKDSKGGVGYIIDYNKKIFNLSSISETNTPARINVSARNPFNNSEIEFNVSGTIRFNTTNSTLFTTNDEFTIVAEKPTIQNEKMVFSYKLQKGLSYKDEWDNTISINSSGVKINTKSDCGIKLNDANKTVSLNNSNYDLEVNETGISLGAKNKSKESAVYGEKLVSLLSDLLDAITVLTVTPASLGTPTPPPNNFAQFIALKGRLTSLLSTVVTLE